ncbi:tRNA-dependent cyclodipeptide synthase, partial [archaeon]|nr:tRNA-dependent cyclodipeptide synthase [archaeon]
MIIKNYLNTTKEEVESKKYNVWIGISLGNKLFTSENIKEYILWALDNTKEDVLVVIGDGLHAINLEVLDGLQRIAAVRKAIRIGDKKQEEIDSILKELPNEKAKLV